ncbi:MAG: PrsW family intramembrane metalloprotease [Clostridium sp.]|nr:PrsW family intramembrane metalloprotease [Clostridium sp.]
MQILLVLLSALAPVAVALWYILKKDSAQPEPTKWLAKAFWYGVLSALLSFAFSTPLGVIFGLELDAEVYPSIFNAFADAFLLAAIPEELAKLIMLWLLLRKNPHFDEKFDGIVYAVCIGMGFAGIENVMYLIGGFEDGTWVGMGISRALFSIPGHFLFAVLMGYYYSLYHFGIDRSTKAKAVIIVAPILAHGLFDGILFSMHVDEGFAVICLFLFLYFFNKLRKRGKERIESLMNQ